MLASALEVAAAVKDEVEVEVEIESWIEAETKVLRVDVGVGWGRRHRCERVAVEVCGGPRMSLACGEVWGGCCSGSALKDGGEADRWRWCQRRGGLRVAFGALGWNCTRGCVSRAGRNRPLHSLNCRLEGGAEIVPTEYLHTGAALHSHVTPHAPACNGRPRIENQPGLLGPACPLRGHAQDQVDHRSMGRARAHDYGLRTMTDARRLPGQSPALLRVLSAPLLPSISWLHPSSGP